MGCESEIVDKQNFTIYLSQNIGQTVYQLPLWHDVLAIGYHFFRSQTERTAGSLQLRYASECLCPTSLYHQILLVGERIYV